MVGIRREGLRLATRRGRSGRGRAAKGGWWSALLAGVQKPLGAALERLADHERTVANSWRRRLERLGFTAHELASLSSLGLAAYLPHVKAGRFESFALALEETGQSLARSGMPETRAVAALSAYVESALPHLAAEDDGTAALTRFAFAGALSLMAGYSTARTASWRSFGEQERHRLSRDLHDEIGHHLVVLKLYLGMMSREMATSSPARIKDKVDEATGLVGQTIESVRRLILDLGPVALEGVAFVPALKLYARQFSARTGVKVQVRDRGLPALPASHERALYRMLQGALSNVVKHAAARTVTVTVRAAKGPAVAMSIEDDGVGFDDTVPRQAFGLAAMRDRVASLGGLLRVASRPAARGRSTHGTRIDVELPLAAAPPDL
jgi:signal transduction histidine kinase